jgi:hypothetical protein
MIVAPGLAAILSRLCTTNVERGAPAHLLSSLSKSFGGFRRIKL